MTNQHVTLVVTSERLVTEFRELRNRDDKVKVGAANHFVSFSLFFKVSVILHFEKYTYVS